MQTFEIQTSRKIETVDITMEVESRIKNGKAVLVYVPHATAALVINEFEPGMKQDMEKFYGKLANGEWKHNCIDDNAEAHLMSGLLSPSVVVPVENNELILGTWQRIILVDLDGPRNRKIVVQEF